MQSEKPLFLTTSDWVGHLDDPIRADVIAHFRYQSYQAGDVIYQQNAHPEYLYHIDTGQVRISSFSPDGKEHVHVIFQDGEGFGDLEIIDGQPRCSAAVVNTRSRIGQMEKKDFVKLREKHRQLDNTLILLYCQRVRYLLSWLEDATHLELSQRIARRLSLIGMTYGQPSKSYKGGIDIDVTQENLAKMLGAARQSVGKQLKLMESAGMLKIHYGTITLFEPIDMV